MDLLAHVPLCASSILFFMRYTNMSSTAGYVGRLFLLCASLFLLWYFVMLLIGWYDPAMHVIASLSSVFLVATGNSWGILGKMAARA